MQELFLGISLDGDEPFEVIYRVCIAPGVERWRHSGSRKHCGSPEPYLTTRRREQQSYIFSRFAVRWLVTRKPELILFHRSN